MNPTKPDTYQFIQSSLELCEAGVIFILQMASLNFTQNLPKGPAASTQQRWNLNSGFPDLNNCNRNHMTDKA